MELDTADSALIKLKPKVALLGGNDVTQGRDTDLVCTRSYHIRAFMRPSVPLKDFGTPPWSIPPLFWWCATSPAIRFGWTSLIEALQRCSAPCPLPPCNISALALFTKQGDSSGVWSCCQPFPAKVLELLHQPLRDQGPLWPLDLVACAVLEMALVVEPLALCFVISEPMHSFACVLVA